MTLAFSGNELTGSLPDCIASLQNLQTLRVSYNHLTGTLPRTINNMTSLKVLDLSANEIQGRVPATLGDISPNLGIVQLQLNRLSCDLPASVLGWQASSANASINLLDGNLFGCGEGNILEIFTLSIQGAAGLRNASEEAFDAYRCGSSVYVLPIITVAIFAVPVVIWLSFLYCRGRLALQWRFTLAWMVNPSTLINELDLADRQFRALALGVMAAATVASSMALAFSLHVAKSGFDCEYMATPTLANKYESDGHALSIGVGAAVCAGLNLGLAPWWRRLVAKFSSSANDYGGIVAVKNNPINVLEEDAEAWDFDAERKAESPPQKPNGSLLEALVRVFKLLVLMMTLVILTIGPNVGYVLVTLSELALKQKIASEMAVTIVKTTIWTLLVPVVARKAVDLIVLNSALTFVRFRLRMAITTALSAMTVIILPVSIVLVTDKRCLYYIIKPQSAVDTAVPFSYCSITNFLTGSCYEYATSSATSIYTPSFAYDGAVCVSAVISVYGPVFLGTVLLSATLPAGIETLLVPWLAPWCYLNTGSSALARTGLMFLHAVTWNVWPALANAGVLSPDFTLGASKLDYLAQRVVERAFMQVLTTLLVALTFGIAVPSVGGACAVAAFVHLLHHRHVLGQIVGLGRLEQPAVVPNIMGCTDVPVACSPIVVVTVVLVWVCGTVGYLEPAVIGCMLLSGLILASAACGVAAWWRRYHMKAPQHEDQAQSTVSSDVSQAIQMETLFGAPKIQTVTNQF